MSTPPDAARIIVATEVAPAAQGLARQEELLGRAVRGDMQPVCLLWRSMPALMVTTSDEALPTFPSARQVLEQEGWPVLARRSGGGAFPIGPGTLQIALLERCAREHQSIEAAYEALAAPIVAALHALALDARIGRVSGAACGGRYDIAVRGRKVAGLAQRWRRATDGSMCVATTASLIIDMDAAELVGVINRLYALAGETHRYRADAMTSVAAELGAAGEVAPAGDLASRVVRALSAALAPGQPQGAISGPAVAA